MNSIRIFSLLPNISWYTALIIFAYFLRLQRNISCVDCGQRWQYDDLPGKSLHCKAILTFHDKPCQRLFKEWNYYSVIQTYHEFTVINTFYIEKYINICHIYNAGDFYLVSQYWFSDNCGQVIQAKNNLMFSFYTSTPINLISELNDKQSNRDYDYIAPYQIYPKYR